MRALIQSTLVPLGVPVDFAKSTNNTDKYIVYHLIDETGQEFADGKEIATSYIIQVDVYDKSGKLDIADRVKEAMVDAGFIKRPSAFIELYEKLKIYRKVMRFYYLKK